MKKIVTIILYITIFCSFSLIIYISSYKYMTNSKLLNKYIENKTVFELINIKDQDSISFIKNINDTYDDLKNMNYSLEQIKEIEKQTNLDKINNDILKNKINYLINDKKIITKYNNKSKLDKKLTSNIKDKKLKKYILDNDNKIIKFEQLLNVEVQNIKNNSSKIKYIINNNYLIFIIIFIISTIIIINLNNSIIKINSTILISCTINILSIIITSILLNYKYKTNFIFYYLNDYITKYLNLNMFIYIILITISIISILIIKIINKNNTKKIKPRIGKVDVDEEIIGF